MEDSCSKVTSNFTFTANDSDTQCCLISQRLKLLIFQVTSVVIFFFPRRSWLFVSVAQLKRLLDVKNITWEMTNLARKFSALDCAHMSVGLVWFGFSPCPSMSFTLDPTHNLVVP